MHAIEFPLAALAGLATVASPCVLPVLPILLGVSAGGQSAGQECRQDRGPPLLIVAGFVLSFSGFALALGAVSASAQLAQETLRNVALALLALSGLLRLWPAPWDRLVAWSRGAVERLRGGAPATVPSAAQGSAFVLGLSLGAVWTPCAGPVLASILALVVQAREPQRAALLIGLYALGAAIPMLGLIHGGRLAAQRVRALARHALALQRVFGVLVIVSAAAIWLQLDGLLVARIAFIFPTLKGL
jgi:cytochrome c biogenesis protein CcdA